MSTTSWSPETVAEEIQHVAEEIADVSGTAMQRLAYCLERLLDGELLTDPKRHVTLFAYALAALRHHAAHGGMSPAQIDKVTALTESVLKLNGHFSGAAKASYLYRDFHAATSLVMAREGRPWLALIESHKSQQVARKAQPVADRALAAAEQAISMGLPALALTHLAGIDASVPSVLLTITASRLAGRRDQALDTLRSLLASQELSPQDHDTIAWDRVVLERLESSNPRELGRAFRQQRDRELDRFGLEAWLWVRTLVATDADKVLPSLRRARDRLPEDCATLRDPFAFKAAQSVEQCHDAEVPLERRLGHAAEALDYANGVTVFECRLLIVAAIGRWLLRVNQAGLAASVLAEYHGLCLKASDGVSKDVLHCFGDLTVERLVGRSSAAGVDASDKSEPIGSSVADLIAISRTLGQVALLVAKGRVQRVFKSNQAEREQFNLENEASIGRLISDLLKRRKGALLKIGQICSYVDGPISDHVQSELEVLQSQVQPIPPTAVHAIFTESFGQVPGALYATFEDVPFAAGSIGQVHRATLKDGRDVVVKVQYPDARRLIELDVKRVHWFRRFFKNKLPSLDLAPLVAEIEAHLIAETDYRQELRSMEEFQQLFAGDPRIVIPAVHRDLSNDRILTMDYAQGQNFADFVASSTQEERDVAGETIMRFVSRSLDGRGIFNADPHPGNYRFHDGKVLFLDFGCVKRLSDDALAKRRRLSRAFLKQDMTEFTNAYVDAGMAKRKADFNPEEAYQGYLHILGHALYDEPFKFDPSVSQAIFRHFASGGNTKSFQMPREVLLATRVEFGLFSVLARLGAEVNWRRIVLKDIFGDEALPPEFARNGDRSAA